jgi:hypothetical protein
MLLAAILLLATLPHAQAAGASQATATPITDGTYSGSLGSYADDWYVTDVPAGKAAFVQYQDSGGSTDAYLVDSDGSTVRYVSNGNSGAYAPEDGKAWIDVSTWYQGASYTFTLSFINVPTQNDGGSGRDAGRSFADAVTAVPGHVTGNVVLASGDAGDTFRLDVPAGMIVDLASVPSYTRLVQADGTLVAQLAGYGQPSSWSGVSDGKPLYVEVTRSGAYGFDYAISWPADLAVSALSVHDVAPMVGDTAAPAGTQREVTFHVANHGAGPTRLGNLLVVATHEGVTSSRVVADRDLSLAAGQETDITLSWDTTGEVGNFTLVAGVTSQYENRTSDNAQSVATSVLAGGLPVGGFDALNLQARSASASAGYEYGGERIGLDTPEGFVGSEHGTVVLLA